MKVFFHVTDHKKVFHLVTGHKKFFKSKDGFENVYVVTASNLNQSDRNTRLFRKFRCIIARLDPRLFSTNNMFNCIFECIQTLRRIYRATKNVCFILIFMRCQQTSVIYSSAFFSLSQKV